MPHALTEIQARRGRKKRDPKPRYDTRREVSASSTPDCDAKATVRRIGKSAMEFERQVRDGHFPTSNAWQGAQVGFEFFISTRFRRTSVA